ncbi:MAG TPA: glycosyl hydrolase [Firmicutes bacterium]|nr:glycosyl hydrolase [Bacillota bacterium]
MLRRILVSICLLVSLPVAGISALPVRSSFPAVLFEGEFVEGIPYRSASGNWSLPFSLIRRHIDPSIVWDQASQSVIITTEDKVLRMPSDALTSFMNLRPFQLSQPARIIDGEPYVPLEIIESLCSLDCSYKDRTNILVVNRTNIGHTFAILSRNATLKRGPGIFSWPIMTLRPGEKLIVRSSDGAWARVQTSDGIVGYVPFSTLSDIHTSPARAPEQRTARGRTARPINMTWEYVWGHNPTPILERLPRGLNVISPTWFTLQDPSGNIQANVDPTYVSWAHTHGIKLWPLVSNGFNPELTHEFLNSALNRENFIRQLLAWTNAMRLDGINLDFENVPYEDRDLLVQLVRELVPLAREQGLVISVDVTVKSSSKNWSLCYDRKRLAEAADYLILMAYDQTPASSPIPGPNAGLPWVERGIQQLLEELPPEKLILGIPFYTRIWKQPVTESALSIATSSAASMEQVEHFVRQQKAEVTIDDSTGQKVARWVRDGIEWKVWIEDEETVSARASLASKYGLAGIASWRRGFEKPAIWEAIAANLRPHDCLSSGEEISSTRMHTRQAPPQ